MLQARGRAHANTLDIALSSEPVGPSCDARLNPCDVDWPQPGPTRRQRLEVDTRRRIFSSPTIRYAARYLKRCQLWPSRTILLYSDIRRDYRAGWGEELLACRRATRAARGS